MHDEVQGGPNFDIRRITCNDHDVTLVTLEIKYNFEKKKKKKMSDDIAKAGEVAAPAPETGAEATKPASSSEATKVETEVDAKPESAAEAAKPEASSDPAKAEASSDPAKPEAEAASTSPAAEAAPTSPDVEPEAAATLPAGRRGRSSTIGSSMGDFETPGYVVAKKVDLETQLALDADDDSLTRWKQSLLKGAAETDCRWLCSFVCFLFFWGGCR
jgi:hypothetical protein